MAKNHLFLTGGLGNQLFQYSALLSTKGKNSLVIDAINGSPRSELSGSADLFQFKILDNIKISQNLMPQITKRAVGYSLRSHLEPKVTENSKAWRLLTEIATSLLLSLHLKKVIHIQVPTDLGFEKDLNLLQKNNYLVGYFQSWRWASILQNNTQYELTLKHHSHQLEQLIEKAEKEKPLILHVRLGDYVAENGFGIPSASYYEKATLFHMSKNGKQKIWLFSDDPNNAISRLNFLSKFEVRIIENLEFSAAETLELMRHGNGYVIANSTFSWWAAFLSYKQDATVVYPYPWFKDLTAPRDLAPEHWEPIDAEF
jgi:hypothetical protein